jgi:hypothetical protein
MALDWDSPEVEAAFRDPIWRIGHLYGIRVRDGAVIPFRPRPQQTEVLEMVYRRGWKRLVILKCRQIGFSTLLGVLCCDRLCFMPGQQVSLIDMTLEHARQKLSGIVSIAYDSLDEVLRERLVVNRANAGELSIRYVKLGAAQASTLFAGTHSRGGSNSLLWISEWGSIQVDDAHRSEEILSGSLPSVGNGICVVETTWKGGRHGHLWNIVKGALETPEEQKGPLDWRVIFYPWQDEPGYCDAVPRPLSEETQRYFEGLHNISVSPGQMSWYQRKRAELGMFVKREFPTMMSECFEAPVEGAIYAAEIDKLRLEGR